MWRAGTKYFQRHRTPRQTQVRLCMSKRIHKVKLRVKFVLLTFKGDGVSNEKWGDSARPAWEAAEWRTWMGRGGGVRERGRVRKKKYEGTVISFFLPPAPPAVVLFPSRNHFSLSLIPPITPNHLCCPPLPRSLPALHSLPSQSTQMTQWNRSSVTKFPLKLNLPNTRPGSLHQDK